MKDLEIGINIILNNFRIYWDFFMSDSIPLVLRMVILAPFVGMIVYLIFLVFGGSISGKQNI